MPSAALAHRARDLAAGQESSQRGHLPNLGIDPRRRLDDGKAHIGANVEDENLDRADLALDPLDQRHDIVFDARVEPERVSLAAFRADRLSQLVDRLGMTRPPRHADAKAVPREGARDRGPEPVAGPDHQADSTHWRRFAHGSSLAPRQVVASSLAAGRVRGSTQNAISPCAR